MANDAKIKIKLLSKDEIQGSASKTWSKDEAKGETAKSFVKVSERFKVVHQSTIRLDKRSLGDIKGMSQ